MSINLERLLQLKEQLNKNIKTRHYTKTQSYNPQSSHKSNSARSYGRSLFLTQFDKMQKTKALWRQVKKSEMTPKRQVNSVSSLQDLNRLKTKYRVQLLKKRSKQELFQQNINMIMKIQQIPPKVDAWNYYKPIKSRRSSQSSQEKLQIFQKNMDMIKRIQEIQPKVINWNHYKPKKSLRTQKRIEQKFRIMQQNMKIIQKVQQTSPKVWSWSKAKPKKNKRLIQQRIQRKQKIFEENMKMIQKVQTIPPKVESWADVKFLQKKLKRIKSYQNYDSNKRLETLKLLIQKSEQKLKNQSQRQLKRHKTLPNKLQGKFSINIQKNKEQFKRMSQKIQKIKCSINCWSKPLLSRLDNQNKNEKKRANQRYGILQKIKLNQKLKASNSIKTSEWQSIKQ